MTSFEFPRNSRLNSAADFDKVFKQTDFKVSNRFLLLLARKNQEDHSRLGLIVGKKKLNRAVDRNRVKRRLRESFRARQTNLQHLDVIALVRNDPKTPEDNHLSMQIGALFDRLIDISSDADCPADRT
ncbi:MAG: ribonuclease P protein component [Pseudomonadales bacterium]|nr:ribonuclease P protein component [Pseudomonadales bacterium]